MFWCLCFVVVGSCRLSFTDWIPAVSPAHHQVASSTELILVSGFVLLLRFWAFACAGQLFSFPLSPLVLFFWSQLGGLPLQETFSDTLSTLLPLPKPTGHIVSSLSIMALTTFHWSFLSFSFNEGMTRICFSEIMFLCLFLKKAWLNF